MPNTADNTALTQADNRLALALLISLVLHLLLIFGVHVGAVEQAGKPRQVIEARLVPQAATNVSEVLVPAIEGPVKSQVQDYEPTPEVVSSPSPSPVAETAKPGMPAAAASPVLLDVPLSVDATYYDAKEVDVRPKNLGDPAYPERAAQLNISGKVRVRLLLNEHGGLDEVTLLSADPPDWGFDTAVLEYLKTARFKPAMLKGRPVRSTVEYVLDFSVDEKHNR